MTALWRAHDLGCAFDDAPCGRMTEFMARSAVIEGEAQIIERSEVMAPPGPLQLPAS